MVKLVLIQDLTLEVAALRQALSKGTLVHRRDRLRAEPALFDRLTAWVEEGRVDLKLNQTLHEVVGDGSKVTGAVLASAADGQISRIDVADVFVAIGHEPNTGLFAGQLEMYDGYIVTLGGRDGMATATSVPGVFTAGDVQDHVYRQAITSADTGCMAALDLLRYFEKLPDRPWPIGSGRRCIPMPPN
ncbi:FAD-dependent oxidoreductase [Janthinobacterium sp. PSPC3-1]|uniref:FAD-dependent oxidoreductase n=1 Tax=Janthinobacterium sp. PSPC3-1 TaxID=2804653 RepID=UPI003CE6B44A